MAYRETEPVDYYLTTPGADGGFPIVAWDVTGVDVVEPCFSTNGRRPLDGGNRSGGHI